MEKAIYADRRQNAREGSRAQIAITSVACDPLIPTVGLNLNVLIKFSNYGPTPANKVEIVTVVEPIPKGKSPVFIYDGDPVVKFGSLAPNIEQRVRQFPVTSISTGEQRPLTDELWELLDKDGVRLFTHGRITYVDIFGDSHWLTFCYYLVVPFNEHFAVWSAHNESDD
jgi:hypothetical protein